MIHFLVHDKKDTVGVIVVEGIKAGQELVGWVMEGDSTVHVKALDDIPIGHKLATQAIDTRMTTTGPAASAAGHSILSGSKEGYRRVHKGK